MNDILQVVNNKIIKMKERKLDHIYLTKKELERVKEDETATRLISVLGVNIEVEVTLEDELEKVLYDYDNEVLSLEDNTPKERAIKSILKIMERYGK